MVAGHALRNSGAQGALRRCFLIAGLMSVASLASFWGIGMPDVATACKETRLGDNGNRWTSGQVCGTRNDRHKSKDMRALTRQKKLT